MAKVVITMTDNPQDPGGIHIVTEFDPPMAPGQEYTPAQCLAGEVLDHIAGCDEQPIDPNARN